MTAKNSIFNPTPEHQLLRQSLKEFVSKEVEPQALWHDQNEKFNLELFKKLGPLGLLGLTVKESEGGIGLDSTAVCLVHEELSYSDPGFCLAYLAHSVLCAHNISQNASVEQKKSWLPKLCSGEWVGAMAMSEPAVGTDVLGMQTVAQKQGSVYLIDGRKMWITNGILDDQGQLVDGCLVYAKTKELSKKQISLYFVEKTFKGFKAGQNIKHKTGMRASNTAELVFDRCEVPVSHLIGKEGEALNCMMKNLEIERLALAAMSIGIAKRALDEMNKYASQRQAFGKPIRKFGQTQRYLADSYAEFQACRSYIYHVAQSLNLDEGGQGLETDSAKLVASQMGKRVADHAIQVLGGYGYVGEYCVERLWRDSKLLEIGGGTIEALQKNISKNLDGKSYV